MTTGDAIRYFWRRLVCLFRDHDWKAIPIRCMAPERYHWADKCSRCGTRRWS